MRVNIIVHGVPQLWMCHENLSSPERGRSTTFNIYKLYVISFIYTRPKPAYGRQGLDWDRWARIQFSQVHFGAKLDSTDLLWCKNVTSPTGGSNRPFRCLEEGGRALPKFLEPFQNVSKKHSGYDLLLNKYSGGFREITILM